MKVYRVELASLLLSIVVLGLLAFTSTSYADDGFGGSYGKRSGMERGLMISARMLDRLDLEDTQRQTVDNIFEAAKPELDALREEKLANRAAFDALDPTNASYSVDLEAIAIENGRLATEATLLFARLHNEVAAVLTEDQRAKLEQGIEHRGERGNSRKRGRRN
jgi:Spy/CpxP family protein refolding chaperone